MQETPKRAKARAFLLAVLFCAAAHGQAAQDATNETEAARLMLDNQAIVDVSAKACKAKFSDRAPAIDAWLAAWRQGQAQLIAAAEQINAKSPSPTLSIERHTRAESQISPGFTGGATDEQLQAFCSQLFAPGTQDRLRDSQPQTVAFLTDAYARMQKSGELK